MTTSVHDPDISAITTLYFYVAGVRQSSVLHNGESIHIGADVDRGTRAIAHKSNDSVRNDAGRIVPAEVVGDVITKLAQLCRDES